MATPSSSSPREPAVFGTAIEALLERALRSKIDAATHAKLRELKIDLGNLRVAYDYLTWHALLEHLTSTIYPGVARDAAYFRLGKDYMRGLEHTLVGKAIFAAGRLAGPRRTLERMTRNVRSANNYMESRLEALPDGSHRMEYFVVPPLLPAMAALPPPSVHYFHGILEAALEASGAKQQSVVLEDHDVARRFAVYRIRFA